MNLKYWVGGILVVIVLGFSSPSLSATLFELIKAAKSYDAAYLAAYAQYEAIVAKRAQTRAPLLPNINAQGNVMHNDQSISYDNDVLPPTSRNFTSNGYTVQLTQSLFHLANIMGYRQSGYLVKQAEAQLAQAEAELILKTAQTYYDMLLAKGTLEQLKAQKKAIAEQQAAAEMSYKIGAANITDVQEAKAKLELVNAQELEAENEIINKRLTLQTLAGKDISEPDGAHGEPSLPEPNDVNVWLSKVESNPSVKAATALLEAADTEVVKVKSGHLPSVDLVAAYGDNTQWSGANDPASTRTESKAVGVQVQFPIFSGGGTHAKVKEALLTRKKAKMDLENTKRQGALQINQAFVGVQLGVMQFKAQSAGVEASETALKSNNTGYSVGIRTNMDVLNAQQQLYAAMRDMNRARYNVLMQMLKLKTFTGENLDFQINPAKPVKDNNENKGR